MTKFISIAEEIGNILSKSKNKDLHDKYILLNSRLQNPQSFVTFIGETSSGKSTLINGFLKQNILPFGSKPITGTVTQINCKNVDENIFFAINRDSSISEIDRDMFINLSKEPDDNLLRLYTEISPTDSLFVGLNIFDTPGFDSINVEHEEVLKKFIPESDVIVFVVSYRIGFKSEDYRFMKIIEGILEKDINLPVLLVINRCPEKLSKQDKRLKEICNYASDTIHRQIESYLIESVISEDSQNIFPFSETLWNKINYYANSKERIETINEKSKNILINLSDIMILDCKNSIFSLSVSLNDIPILEDEIKNLHKNFDLSLIIIEKYINKLKNILPKLIKEKIDNLINLIKNEIFDSNKWVDKDACLIFLNSHIIPFHVNKIFKDIENYISETFEKMDQELDEMANKSVNSLNIRAESIDSPDLSNLLESISLKLSANFGKELMFESLKSLGGIGGYASGAGNLAKMAVSKTGHFFGKTFGREVYNQIGKQFTKNFLQKLNIFALIFTDLVSIVWDSNTWQNKLFKKMEEGLNKVCIDSVNDLKEKDLVTYEKSNKDLVKDIYDSMEEEIKSNINRIKNKIDLSQKYDLENHIKSLENCKKEMDKL